MKLMFKALILALAAFVLVRPAYAAEPLVPYTPERFSEAQAAGKTIVVDVFADWCPTCAAQAPTLESLRADDTLAGVVFMQVDFDTQKDFLRAHRIPRQSTIVVFRGTEETGRSIAETDPARLRNFVYESVG